MLMREDPTDQEHMQIMPICTRMIQCNLRDDAHYAEMELTWPDGRTEIRWVSKEEIRVWAEHISLRIPTKEQSGMNEDGYSVEIARKLRQAEIDLHQALKKARNKYREHHKP